MPTISVVLNKAEELTLLWTILERYSITSGLIINRVEKSKILPIGHWPIQPQLPHLQVATAVKILGVIFSASIGEMQHLNWREIVRKVKVAAKDLYFRDLCLLQRSRLTHMFLLSKCWYMAQILPLTNVYARQISSAISWYLWKGNIFRVPLSTLYRNPEMGGIGLIDVSLKCLALFLSRGKKIQMNDNSFSASWIKYWSNRLDLRNPPDLQALPRSLYYLQLYFKEWCYIDPALHLPSHNHSNLLYQELLKAAPTTPMRIQSKTNTETNFDNILRNISSRTIADSIRSTWYMAVHDIVATGERLFKIRRSNSEQCISCQQPDTILHRLTCSDQKREIVESAIGYIHRLGIATCTAEQFLRPDYQITPKTRLNTVNWIIGHTVYYILQSDGPCDKTMYHDFLQRTRWKQLQKQNCKTIYADYLSVIDT